MARELSPGQTVTFKGLQGATHLNGTAGKVVRFDAAQQRWVIRTAKNALVKAKAENLSITETSFEDNTDDFRAYVDNAQVDVDASDANWRAQRTHLPGLDALDAAILDMVEHFRRSKKLTGVALKDRVVGIGIGCKSLLSQGGEDQKLVYHDLISKRLGTRGMQVLDQESLRNLCPCDAAIVMRDENQERNEELSLIQHALLPEAMFMIIKLNPPRKESEQDIGIWVHLKVFKEFPLSLWCTRSSCIVYHSNSFRVIRLVKRACRVNAWSCPYGDQIPSNRLVASFNTTEDDFPMNEGESYLAYNMLVCEALSIRTSTKERKSGGQIKGGANDSNTSLPVFGTMMTNKQVNDASEKLQKYGLVIIKGLLPPSQTVAWGEAALSDLNSAVTRLKCNPTGKVDLLNPRSAKEMPLNFKELTMEDMHIDLRSGPEMEKLRMAEDILAMHSIADSFSMTIKVLNADTKKKKCCPTMIHANIAGTVESWRFHPSILAIIKNVFNPRTRKGPLYKGNLGRSKSGRSSNLDGSPQPFRLGQVGSIISCPGASDQEIRANTSHLFEHDICLPSHSLSVITPGYQIVKDSSSPSSIQHEFTDDGMWTGNSKTGGMAFVLGSHKLDVTARLMSQEYRNDNERMREEMLRLRTLRPSLEAGDVLIFDDRTLHFKMANKISAKGDSKSEHVQVDASRFMPMLYFNATQAWFQESIGNEHKKIFD